MWRRSTLDGYLYSDLRGSGDSRSIASSSACAFSMCTAGGALAIVLRSSFAGLGTSAELVTALSSPARLGSCCSRRRITTGLHDHIPCGHTGADKKQPRPERASGTS